MSFIKNFECELDDRKIGIITAHHVFSLSKVFGKELKNLKEGI